MKSWAFRNFVIGMIIIVAGWFILHKQEDSSPVAQAGRSGNEQNFGPTGFDEPVAKFASNGGDDILHPNAYADVSSQIIEIQKRSPNDRQEALFDYFRKNKLKPEVFYQLIDTIGPGNFSDELILAFVRDESRLVSLNLLDHLASLGEGNQFSTQKVQRAIGESIGRDLVKTQTNMGVLPSNLGEATVLGVVLEYALRSKKTISPEDVENLAKSQGVSIAKAVDSSLQGIFRGDVSRGSLNSILSLVATHPDKEKRINWTTSLASSLASNDVLDTIKLLKAVPEGDLQNGFATGVIGQWARHDLLEASKWVDANKDSAFGDYAKIGLIGVMSVESPEDVKNWISTMKDTELRAKLENLLRLSK